MFAFCRAPAMKLVCAGEKLTSTPFGDGWKRWASFFCGCRSLCLLLLPASGWSGFWSSGSIQAELLVLLAMAVVAERCCRWPPGPGAAVQQCGAVRRLAGPGGALARAGAAGGDCCGGASPRLRVRVSSLFRRLLFGGGDGFALQ